MKDTETNAGLFDSLMFDMDGTLWDAVDSYCAIWNACIDECCPDVKKVDRATLSAMMGKPLDFIYNTLIGNAAPTEKFMERLDANEAILMPKLGGRLYPGVTETISELSKRYRLFMVSNCTHRGLPVFLEFTGLKPYFTDAVSFGETGHEKDVNIAMLMERYGLKAPLYIGDTQGDCRSSHAAGVPFAWAKYGFGKDVNDAEYTLNSITDLTKIC